jgi:hypothetical protein
MSVPSRGQRDIRWLRAIFGRYASPDKGRILLRALVVVASVDFATKLLAVALLMLEYLKGIAAAKRTAG